MIGRLRWCWVREREREKMAGWYSLTRGLFILYIFQEAGRASVPVQPSCWPLHLPITTTTYIRRLRRLHSNNLHLPHPLPPPPLLNSSSSSAHTALKCWVLGRVCWGTSRTGTWWPSLTAVPSVAPCAKLRMLCRSTITPTIGAFLCVSCGVNSSVVFITDVVKCVVNGF